MTPGGGQGDRGPNETDAGLRDIGTMVPRPNAPVDSGRFEINSSDYIPSIEPYVSDDTSRLGLCRHNLLGPSVALK
jgi:hypothetical protein